MEVGSPEAPEKASRSAVANAGNAGDVTGKIVMQGLWASPVFSASADVCFDGSDMAELGTVDDVMRRWICFIQEKRWVVKGAAQAVMDG